jgi:hypothetical protein
MMEFLIENGAYVCWDDRKLKDFVEPVEFFRDFYYNKVDNLVVLNHDSDDIYHPEAFSELMNRDIEEGTVFIFRNGYVYDRQTRRLAHYEGMSSPPPFYAMTFANRALKNQKAWDKFCDEYNLKLEHPHLDYAKRTAELSDGKFLYLFHTHNVTSSWDNPHHVKHIVHLVTGERKKDVLESEFRILYGLHPITALLSPADRGQVSLG